MLQKKCFSTYLPCWFNLAYLGFKTREENKAASWRKLLPRYNAQGVIPHWFFQTEQGTV